MKFGTNTYIMIMKGKRHPEAVHKRLTLQGKVIKTLRKLVRRSQNLLCRVSCQWLKRVIWVNSVSCRISCCSKVIKKESLWVSRVMILSVKLNWILFKLLLTCLLVLIFVDSYEPLGFCLQWSIPELWNQESLIYSFLKLRFF